MRSRSLNVLLLIFVLSLPLQASAFFGTFFNNRTYYKEGAVYHPPGALGKYFSVAIDDLPVCRQAGLYKKETYSKARDRIPRAEVQFSDDFGNSAVIYFIKTDGTLTPEGYLDHFHQHHREIFQKFSHTILSYESHIMRNLPIRVITAHCPKASTLVVQTGNNVSQPLDLTMGILLFHHNSSLYTIIVGELPSEQGDKNVKNALYKIFNTMKF